MYAKIDRPAGIVTFVRPKTGDEVLNEWSSDVGKLMGLVEKSCHLIAKVRWAPSHLSRYRPADLVRQTRIDGLMWNGLRTGARRARCIAGSAAKGIGSLSGTDRPSFCKLPRSKSAFVRACLCTLKKLQVGSAPWFAERSGVPPFGFAHVRSLLHAVQHFFLISFFRSRLRVYCSAQGTMSAYPLVHSHLLVKRLLSLNKPKSLAPALHCESHQGPHPGRS